MTAADEGGSIRQVRKKSPKKENQKIEQAMEYKARKGGSIRQARKKSPKKENQKMYDNIKNKK